jgi:hypothetical protein
MLTSFSTTDEQLVHYEQVFGLDFSLDVLFEHVPDVILIPPSSLDLACEPSVFQLLKLMTCNLMRNYDPLNVKAIIDDNKNDNRWGQAEDEIYPHIPYGMLRWLMVNKLPLIKKHLGRWSTLLMLLTRVPMLLPHELVDLFTVCKFNDPAVDNVIAEYTKKLGEPSQARTERKLHVLASRVNARLVVAR